MRQNPKTEEELSESFWWWRHCIFAVPPDPVNIAPGLRPNVPEKRGWNDGMEQIAQEWELIRRVHPDFNWPPFYDVNGFITENLRARLITKRQLWTKKMTTEISPAGWTDPDAEGYVWNLGCTKDKLRRQYAMRFLATQQEISQVFAGTLTVEQLAARRAERRRNSPSISEFLRWIDAQAKSKGIQLPRGLSHQRNRKISWAWVEILDIAKHVATRRNPLRKLSSAERKMKTLATNTAKKLLPQYLAALSEISAIPRVFWGDTPDLMDRERRILLGQWTPKTNW